MSSFMLIRLRTMLLNSRQLRAVTLLPYSFEFSSCRRFKSVPSTSIHHFSTDSGSENKEEVYYICKYFEYLRACIIPLYLRRLAFKRVTCARSC